MDKRNKKFSQRTTENSPGNHLLVRVEQSLPIITSTRGATRSGNTDVEAFIALVDRLRTVKGPDKSLQAEMTLGNSLIGRVLAEEVPDSLLEELESTDDKIERLKIESAMFYQLEQRMALLPPSPGLKAVEGMLELLGSFTDQRIANGELGQQVAILWIMADKILVMLEQQEPVFEAALEMKERVEKLEEGTLGAKWGHFKDSVTDRLNRTGNCIKNGYHWLVAACRRGGDH